MRITKLVEYLLVTTPGLSTSEPYYPKWSEGIPTISYTQKNPGRVYGGAQIKPDEQTENGLIWEPGFDDISIDFFRFTFLWKEALATMAEAIKKYALVEADIPLLNTDVILQTDKELPEVLLRVHHHPVQINFVIAAAMKLRALFPDGGSLVLWCVRCEIRRILSMTEYDNIGTIG